MDKETLAAFVDNLDDGVIDSIPVSHDEVTHNRQPAGNPTKHGLTHSQSNLSIGFSVLPGQPKLSLSTFAAASDQILDRFMESNESAIAVDALRQLNCSIYHDTLLVKAIQKVITAPESVQSQMASLITVAFDSKLITRPQVTRAFEKLIQMAESLHSEIDGIEDRLFNFFAAAADDSVVDATFLARLPEALLRHLSPPIADNEPHLAKNIYLLKAYKARCQSFMDEFFNCGDVEVVENFFQEVERDLFTTSASETVATVSEDRDQASSAGDTGVLIPPITRDLFRHEFVRRVLISALAQPNLQKEMVSRCLSELYGSGPNQLNPDDIQLGLLRLLASVEDLALDCPKASEIISNFIVRMNVDDILPPAFVSDFLRLHLGDAMGVETLRRAFRWMTESAKHHLLAERFQKVWTGTDGNWPEVEEFKRALRDIIFDYFNTADVQAAVKEFNGLEMSPDQEVEAIRKIIVFALERQHEEWNLAIGLLVALIDAGEIDSEVILKGFNEIGAKLADIELDCPAAMAILEGHFVPHAIEEKWLPETFSFKQFKNPE